MTLHCRARCNLCASPKGRSPLSVPPSRWQLNPFCRWSRSVAIIGSGRQFDCIAVGTFRLVHFARLAVCQASLSWLAVPRATCLPCSGVSDQLLHSCPYSPGLPCRVCPCLCGGVFVYFASLLYLSFPFGLISSRASLFNFTLLYANKRAHSRRPLGIDFIV